MGRRIVAANPGELKIAWGSAGTGERPQIVYAWGADGASKADGWLLYGALSCGIRGERSLFEELEARGYDLKTFRLTVRRTRAPEKADG